jgi:hypothetical protein
LQSSVYHKPQYLEKKELITFEARWKEIKKVKKMVIEGNAKYSTDEDRVDLSSLTDFVIKEARDDGCLFIPFEETSKASVRKEDL